MGKINLELFFDEFGMWVYFKQIKQTEMINLNRLYLTQYI